MSIQGLHHNGVTILSGAKQTLEPLHGLMALAFAIKEKKRGILEKIPRDNEAFHLSNKRARGAVWLLSAGFARNNMVRPLCVKPPLANITPCLARKATSCPSLLARTPTPAPSASTTTAPTLCFVRIGMLRSRATWRKWRIISGPLPGSPLRACGKRVRP